MTGNLGNVIKESVQVAQSLVRANANIYELDLDKFEKVIFIFMKTDFRVEILIAF